MSLRLFSYNIRFGGRGREGRLAAVIRDVAPDLVVFQEATDPRVIEYLAGATGLSHWAGDSENTTGKTPSLARTAIARFLPSRGSEPKRGRLRFLLWLGNCNLRVRRHRMLCRADFPG